MRQLLKQLIPPFVTFLLLTSALTIAILTVKVDQTTTQLENQTTSFQTLQTQYDDTLFDDHLAELEKQQLEAAKKQIEDEYNRLISEESTEKLQKIETIYEKYQVALEKIDRNSGVNVDTTTYTEKIKEWGVALLDQKLDELTTTIDETNTELDSSYQEYLASLPTPTPKPVAPPVQNTAPVEGYSFQRVSTERGTFSTHVIRLPLSSYRVKTVTANNDNCSNNCPAKSLSDYVSENGAYAGIHGSYFCPPDYASCSGKAYSYDFGVYNSNLGKWLNSHALKWNNLGLATFNGNTAAFYNLSYNYNGQPVTAGISNFPSLLEDGGITTGKFSLTAYQNAKGPRGAIGVDDSNIYLVIVTGASVTGTAYVMQALGAKHALNLDGGGSSAMFIAGGYKVGPGRSLPNVILLIR